MRTEYQISGSTPVTSRENGALHDTVIDEVLLAVSRFTTDDSRPVKRKIKVMSDIASHFKLTKL